MMQGKQERLPSCEKRPLCFKHGTVVAMDHTHTKKKHALGKVRVFYEGHKN